MRPSLIACAILFLMVAFLTDKAIGQSGEAEGSGQETAPDAIVEGTGATIAPRGEGSFISPFRVQIAKPFEEWQVIHLIGTMNANPKRVSFKMHKGFTSIQKSEMAMNLDAKDDVLTGRMIYNKFRDERDDVATSKNNFVANGDFDLRLRLTNNSYEVFVNREKLGNFKRKAVDIDSVSLSGDVAKVRAFNYFGTTIFLPLSGTVNLGENKRLDISGYATGKKINVALYRANDDPVLELSIKLDEGKTDINGFTEDGAWGDNVQIDNGSLKPNQVFDITIVNTGAAFNIYYNYKLVNEFKLRGGDKDDVKTLGLTGDFEPHLAYV